jgi:hypothetical protein
VPEAKPLEALEAEDHISFSSGRRSSPAREPESQKKDCGALDLVARP